jgi:ATP-dependent Lhr-like helicase
LGTGKQKLTLAFPTDYVLFGDADEPTDDPHAALVIGKLSDAGRGLGFFDLAEATGIDTGALAQTLWSLAWQGRVSSDSFETARRGLLNGFSAERVAEHPGRGGFRRWERSRPSAGTWQLVRKERGDGSIESAEIDKERARIVLGRYGVVFRELLEHELPPLRWSRLFRALRLLELSGEIVAGHFFDGVPGLQFATHEAVRKLAEPLPPDPLYFLNACDPASLAGLGLPGLPPELPRRIPGNWMVGQGDALVVVLQKGGRELTIVPQPGHASLGAALAIFHFLLGRQSAASTSASVESINGESALASPYLDDLRRAGFVNDYRGLSLWKR